MNGNWQDMSCSYRLGNILLVYELAIKFNIKINKEKFKTEILYHIEWLKSHLIHNKTLAFSSNHNLFISRYLILGCNIYNIYFNKLEDLFIDLGIDNFLESISNNVDIIDLLSKEHSTNYHILYYRQLNKLLNIIDLNNKNYNKLKDLSDKMYNNLYYFIYPNNHFVQIGDTDDKLCNYDFKDLISLKEFKNVGYGVYKNNNIYISLSCSCHSRYHKHIDELSINYFDECPILIEGGRYSYDDYKPNNSEELWRNSYFLTQKSKNSIVIDDNYFSFRKIINQLNNKEYTYGTGIINVDIEDNVVVIQGINPLLLKMQNIEHIRKIKLDENQKLYIEDNLLSNDSKQHKSTRHFHFHNDWDLVEIIKNKVIFKHKILNKMLEFEDLSEGEIKYYYGQEKPFIQGFMSHYEHHKIKTPTLEIVNHFKGNIQLKSKIIVLNINFVENIVDGINLVFSNSKSLVRFGDAEYKQLINKNNLKYSQYDETISQLYTNCYSENNNLYIGIPPFFFNNLNLNYSEKDIIFWKDRERCKWFQEGIKLCYNSNKIFLNSFISRLNAFNIEYQTCIIHSIITNISKSKKKCVIFISEDKINNKYFNYFVSHFDTDVYYTKKTHSEFLQESIVNNILQYNSNKTIFLGFIGPLWKKIIIGLVKKYDDKFLLDLGNMINLWTNPLYIKMLKILPTGKKTPNNIIMEPTKIVIITRFGINMKDKEWYDYRYIVHKTFGQQCILNQTNQNFDWLICLDSEPPEDFLIKLKNDFKNKNIHLLHIKKNFILEYRNYIEENILTDLTNKLVIIRKDDDDALNINYIDNIYYYLQNNEIKLHFIEEDNPNMSRVQEFRDKWNIGNKIINLFDENPEIINQLFFSRNGNEEVKIYFKNDYIQSFGSTEKYGSMENQLLSLKNSVKKNINKSFTPFAIINNPLFGFQYKYEENNDKLYISKIPGSSVGIYSILPIKNKKITNYRDCMYENRWGHLNMYKTKGVIYNNIKNKYDYIFVRGLVNDCGEDVKKKYIIDDIVKNISDDIVNDFSLNKKFLQEFKNISKKYNNISINKFKYIVDKNISKLNN